MVLPRAPEAVGRCEGLQCCLEHARQGAAVSARGHESVRVNVEACDSLSEAALDLGCTPMQAFFKVKLPNIMPGVLSGMVMAFTMSLDDFIISYFVGPTNFQTLPLLIYSMTKKTVKPDMYALSSLIFLTVLILLLIVNIGQIKQDRKNKN